MKIGLEFTFTDDSKEYYDPVDNLTIKDDRFIFFVGGYEYEIFYDDVQSYREYEVCDKCGYELPQEGCDNCKEDK